ncbi:hypothetical protein HanRHA438_Chr12g0541011 [Helianthus annuus]|nr:hypothetical protein HanRHA438_Chr12g0541011 [Helianthus annuus]
MRDSLGLLQAQTQLLKVPDVYIGPNVYVFVKQTCGITSIIIFGPKQCEQI